MDNTSEATLIDAARRGDREALTALLEHHEGRIYRYGMKMCAQPQDAEDVLQETMLQAFRSMSDFRGDAAFSSWLFTIARSFCAKKRRQSKFAPKHLASLEQDVPTDGGPIDPGVAPDDAAMTSELRTTLNEAIRKLEVDKREVLVLRDVEQIRAREVAKILGISISAVKSRLHRARIELRERLTPLLDTRLVDRSPDCPDVLTLYAQKLEDEISPSLCAEMEKHLEGCDGCTSHCNALKETLALCSAIPTNVPPRIRDAVREASRQALMR